MKIGYEMRNFTPNNFCRRTVILKSILVPVCEKDTESSDFILGVALKDYLVLAFSPGYFVAEKPGVGGEEICLKFLHPGGS